MDPNPNPNDPWTDWLVAIVLALPLGYVAYLMVTVLFFGAAS